MVIAGLLMAVSGLSPVRRLEWLAEDLRLKLREKWSFVPPTGEVVVVEIDQKALECRASGRLRALSTEN